MVFCPVALSKDYVAVVARLRCSSLFRFLTVGLGYRARLVSSAARTLVRLGGEEFLQRLKQRRDILNSTKGDSGSGSKDHDVFQVEREIHQTLLKFAYVVKLLFLLSHCCTPHFGEVLCLCGYVEEKPPQVWHI